MASLLKNGTWQLVDRPKEQRIVNCKWIFKRKEGIPGVEMARYKARLVASAFTQKEDDDYSDLFTSCEKELY